jgi:predicted Fe-S protein YdhL (DUF1289 family)
MTPETGLDEPVVMTVSPCVAICTLDQDARYCIGCGRTIDEIARWLEMSDDDRRTALDRIAREFTPPPRMRPSERRKLLFGHKTFAP